MTDPNNRRSFIHQATAAGLAMSLGGQARSQADWPQALVRMIVPYPVGGATDILTRLIGRGIAARIGQQLLIDNRAGAGSAWSVATARITKRCDLSSSNSTCHTDRSALHPHQEAQVASNTFLPR